jgi:hypothetical protein
VSSEDQDLSRHEQIGALIPPKLLELLEQAYPLRNHLASTKDSLMEIGVKLGERSLLDFLHSCHEAATQQKVF